MKLVNVYDCKIGDKIFTNPFSSGKMPYYFSWFEVQIEDGEIFLLSNNTDARGKRASNRRGYAFSWSLGQASFPHYGILADNERGMVTAMLQYAEIMAKQ